MSHGHTLTLTQADRALRMLQYMLQHKDEGIQFHEASMVPCAYGDASNKDDPHNGKTEYGYTIN